MTKSFIVFPFPIFSQTYLSFGYAATAVTIYNSLDVDLSMSINSDWRDSDFKVEATGAIAPLYSLL